MTYRELVLAVAKATGESPARIRRIGFSLLPGPVRKAKNQRASHAQPAEAQQAVQDRKDHRDTRPR